MTVVMAPGLRWSRWAVLVLLEPLGACLGQTHTPPVSHATASSRPVSRELLSSRRTPHELELLTSHGLLGVSAPRPDTFRLRVARTASSRRLPSFAVDAGAPPSAPLVVEESDTLLIVRTAEAMLRIDKQPLRLRLMDATGRLIADDVARVEFADGELQLGFGLGPRDRVFGLGDKVRGFDRRGQSFELWNTDAYGWKVDADPLYKSIPFLLLLGAGTAHGLFIDHPGRASIDVGARQADTLSYRARGAEALDLYLFAGHRPKQVLEAYTALTGRTPLPPRWALGHHQSRYGYLSEQEVRGVVARLQQDKFPLDAI